MMGPKTGTIASASNTIARASTSTVASASPILSRAALVAPSYAATKAAQPAQIFMTPPKVLGRTYAPKVLGKASVIAAAQAARPTTTGRVLGKASVIAAARSGGGVQGMLERAMELEGKGQGMSVPSGGGMAMTPNPGTSDDSFFELSSNGDGYTQPVDNAYSEETIWKPMETKTVDDISDFKQTSMAKATELTIKTPTPLSLLDRVLSFLGLSRKSKVTAVMAGEAAAMASMTRTEAAESLVRRARDGDQNAMAMIACVRDAAKRGNTQAALSARLIREYIKSHPVVSGRDAFGAEEQPRVIVENSEEAAAAQLSHGPELTRERIGQFMRAARFNPAEQHSFRHGLEGRLQRNPDAGIQAANKMGRIVGHALKLQGVRLAGKRVSTYDRKVGWELGE